MNKTTFARSLFAMILSSLFSPAVPAEPSDIKTAKNHDKVLHIYQDADLSRHVKSGIAIQRGIEVAFDEIGNEIQGYKVEFKYLDHRGNVSLSKKNYQTFLADPRALVIYSGIHSPPLIKNRTFINESKALTLVPWAAGGPITRHPSTENWIFRLSIDDTRAGPVLIDFAIKQKQCKAPTLLLEQTPWGASNLKSMAPRLIQLGITNSRVNRFNWNLNKRNATVLLNTLINDGSDCIVFVGNAVEGVIFAQVMLKLPKSKRVPIISHWGITGGNFHVKVNASDRQALDLSFIQSCFTYTDTANQDAFSLAVFKRLQTLYPEEIRDAIDLKSAVGFIHAYDLTRLLIQAINQLELTGNSAVDRDAIRRELENIETPVRGLVKTYQQPFSVFLETNNVNAHEALGPEHYCMGKYGDDNEILLIHK